MTSLGYLGSRLVVSVAAPVARQSGRHIRRIRGGRQYHFDAERYLESIRTSMPRYDELQAAVSEAASIPGVRRVLDLGTGTGETAAAVLRQHPDAVLTGVDESAGMLAVARSRLVPQQVGELLVGRLEEGLPSGPFDLVVSALAIHHLSARRKRELFRRIHHLLRESGRFVMADIVRPEGPDDVATPISRIYDRPERAGDLQRWLADAGFTVSCPWRWKDLCVLAADVPAA